MQIAPSDLRLKRRNADLGGVEEGVTLQFMSAWMLFWLALRGNVFTLANVNHNRCRKVLLLAFLLPGTCGFAQTPDARVEQARMRTSPITLHPGTPDQYGEAPRNLALETPGDPDLGRQIILQPRGHATPFSFFASAADYYTDNATLSKSNRQGDGYFFSEVGARYERTLAESLSIEATVRQGFFRYHGLSSQDFNSLNAGTGLYYDWKELGGITVFARYNFERLSDESLGRELLHNHTLSVGAQKTFACQGGNLIYVGYASIFGFAEQPAAERNEHSLYAGAQVHLTPALDADLYARLAFFDYRQGTRRDLNGTVVTALTYHFSRQFAVNASFSFVFDRSNRSRFDYNAATTGGGLSFRYEF